MVPLRFVCEERLRFLGHSKTMVFARFHGLADHEVLEVVVSGPHSISPAIVVVYIDAMWCQTKHCRVREPRKTPPCSFPLYAIDEARALIVGGLGNVGFGVDRQSVRALLFDLRGSEIRGRFRIASSDMSDLNPVVI